MSISSWDEPFAQQIPHGIQESKLRWSIKITHGFPADLMGLEVNMIVWTGAGIQATVITLLLVMMVLPGAGESSTKFFLVSSPFLFFADTLLKRLANSLSAAVAAEQGASYYINCVFRFCKCDFSQASTVYGLPLSGLGAISLLIGIEEWIRVGL